MNKLHVISTDEVKNIENYETKRIAFRNDTKKNHFESKGSEN